MEKKADEFEDSLRCTDILMTLLAKEVITHRELVAIKEEKGIYKQNEALFHIILAKKLNQVMMFRQVLHDTGREPLANFIDFPVVVEPHHSASTASLQPLQEEEGAGNLFQQPHPDGADDAAADLSRMSLDGPPDVQPAFDFVDNRVSSTTNAAQVPSGATRPVALVKPAVKPSVKQCTENHTDKQKLQQI